MYESAIKDYDTFLSFKPKYFIGRTYLMLGLINKKLKNEKETFKWYKKAIDLYEKSAKQGSTRAQFNLGVMYYYGKGINKNFNKSALLIKKSYTNGYERAKNFWEENELWKYE